MSNITPHAGVAAILRGGVELPASKIEVGHCVILNDFEEPSGRMVCVIADSDNWYVWCKYLNSDHAFSTFNHRHGMRISRDSAFHNLTPLNAFGVRIVARYEAGTNTVHGGWIYHCERIGESTATYRDGNPRRWQDREPLKHGARQTEVLISITSGIDE